MRSTRMANLILFVLLVATVTVPIAGAQNDAPAKNNITYLPDEGKVLMSNGQYWIKIDPVSDRIVGDPVIISGITNLPAGSQLLDSLSPDKLPHCAKYSCSPPLDQSQSDTMIYIQTDNSSGSNIHSAMIPTDDLVPLIYRYDITDTQGYGIYSKSIGPSGGTIILFPNSTRETISILNSPSPPSPQFFWIAIDPIQGMTSDYQTDYQYFMVNGSTNLPEEVGIPYTIFSENELSYPYSEGISVSYAPNRGYIIPEKKAGINRFIVKVNTSGLNAGITYWITLWNPRYNASMPNDFLSASTSVYLQTTTPMTASVSTSTPVAPLSIFNCCASLIGFAIIVIFFLQKKHER